MFILAFSPIYVILNLFETLFCFSLKTENVCHTENTKRKINLIEAASTF